MAEDVAIALNNVSKCFKRYEKPSDRLKEVLLPGKSRAQEFWALRDITLEVRRGETLGVIGQNGSGKSTLLQIIAGTLTPTIGEVKVNGRVSALLELGSGFNPEFTGRQNVFFNGQILGLSQAEVAAKFDDIVAFADIGDFIDQPVKTYSSGMFVRLAFAVAINVDPDILIVDEALSVGDGIFVHRCMAKIKNFQDTGGTILFVSHDVGTVTRLCSQTVWINKGILTSSGKPSEISREYQAWVYDQINAHQKTKIEDQQTPQKFLVTIEESLGISDSLKKKEKKLNETTGRIYKAFSQIDRFGTGRAEIIGFEVLDKNNNQVNFLYPGEVVRIIVRVLSHEKIEQPIIGVLLYDRLRMPITGFNTYQYQYEIPVLLPYSVLNVEFQVKWPEIHGGSYVMEPAIADGSQDSHEMLDWLQLLFTVESSASDLTFGIMRLPEVKISHQIHVEIEENYKYF